MISEEKIDEWWREYKKTEEGIGYFDYYGFGSRFRDFIKEKLQSSNTTVKEVKE